MTGGTVRELASAQAARPAGYAHRRPEPARLARPGTAFAALDESSRAALLSISAKRVYGPNEFVYLQDDEADCLHFIREGHVRLSYLMEDGSAVLCAILPPGECFGELAVFDRRPHCDTATAVGSLTLTSVPAEAFRLLAARQPAVAQALAGTVATRYRAYVDLTRALSLKTLSARLAQAVLRLADGLGSQMAYRGRTVPCVAAVVTQTDLGLMARGARGNVNRALKAWEANGWIALHDRCIAILDRDELENLSISEGL